MPNNASDKPRFNIDPDGAGQPSYPLDKMRGQDRNKGRARNEAMHKKAGRVPPQATEVEKSVLGAMLLEREAIPKAIQVLTPDAFYSGKHEKIYVAMLNLFEQGDPVDLVTLTNELKRREQLDDVGGGYYLSELTTEVASAANVEYHARIIAEKSLLRKMIETMTDLVGQAYEPGADAFELLDDAEGQIFQISDNQLRKAASPINEVVKDTLEQLESIHGQEGGITGVPSGFRKLDDLTSGWQPSDLIIVAARPSMGKCLGRGTPIMMYDGTVKPVETIAVGDRIMGDDGEPRTVNSLARGREPMYWVRQKQGMDYRVNESHILSLKKSRRGSKRARGSVTDISVREYLNTSDKWKNENKGFKVSADFEERPVPLDPYFLGLWLGDGKSNNARIYTTDDEVVSYLQTFAKERGDTVSTYDVDRACPAYLVKSGERGTVATRGAVQATLRDLDLLNNKHIPQIYLGNSRTKRLRLLAGLIDSDGHLNRSHGGTYEITQASNQLAHQIKFLCDTLGYRTSITAKTAHIASTGYSSEVYRVRFNGNVDEIPVRISRKQATPRTDGRNWQVTGIEVEPDGVGEYYGFTLDGNGRFLLADGTVTHNTAFSLACGLNAATHPERPTSVAIFSLEMGSKQLAQRLLTSEARVDAQRARTGRMKDEDWQNLARAAGKLSDAELFIDDTPGLSVLELRAKCRRLKAEHGLGLVVVDYLQLMQASSVRNNSNREQEIAHISRSLKGLAKELDVPVIALSQLNRGVENRGGDKRPQLSDLRESGCLTGDTLVPLADTGECVPMRELCGRKGFKVWSVNPKTYELEKQTVSNAFCTGTKPVYRLETQLGRQVRATGNHKFLTVDGWKRLDELEKGERIALPRHLPASENQTIGDDELALLGHLIGDGCTLPTHAIQYTTRELDLAEKVVQLAKSVFGDKVAPRIVKEKNWYQVYLTSTRSHTHGVRSAVGEWLEELGVWGLRSHEKQVPSQVFQQSTDAIATFLSHLWATDGCIRMRGGKSPYPAVYYSTSSKQLALNVQSLLVRLGINARRRFVDQKDKGRPQYHVIVSGAEDLTNFAVLIGAQGAYKKESLSKIEDYLDNKTSNTNRDIVPKATWRSLVVPAMKKKKMTARQMQSALGMSYCGTSLYRSNMSRERASRVANVVSSEPLRRLAESDIYWDEVAVLEPDGVEQVYDLTVPGLQNFVANDIVVHNSIEQDADVVAFIYRAERYGITVDDQGNSTEGIAEIIIGKQRNGPIGTVELAFVDRYARFENLTTRYENSGSGGGGHMGGGGMESSSDDGSQHGNELPPFGGDSGSGTIPPPPPDDADAPF